MEELSSATPWEGMPRTRYQGSKRKLLPLLHAVFENLSFTSCLDAFGGTGAVTHLLRCMGKRVVYNDILASNAIMASALFTADDLRLEQKEIQQLFEKQHDRVYREFIQENFQSLYYLHHENEQLDVFCENVRHLEAASRTEALYLLFQAMLSKRPYNIFHRANVNLRTRDVKRSFGNKATWDRSFVDHMEHFYRELFGYRKLSTAPVEITSSSAFEVQGDWDLVYIDPPYARNPGRDDCNYFNFYHLLDAVVFYDRIPDALHESYAHRPFYHPRKCWHERESLESAFHALIEKFYPVILVISYRSDGYPSPEQLKHLLQAKYMKVDLIELSDYRYVLSSKNSSCSEIVLVATNN